MAFAPRTTVAIQSQPPIRAQSHKKSSKRAPSKKKSHSVRSPIQSIVKTQRSDDEPPLWDYASITWNNLLLLGYDRTHDAQLNYTVLYKYHSIQQFNHIIYYILCKARSIQCTLQYNTSDKYKDLLTHFKQCYPVLDIKQQREFNTLCYTVIHGFTHVISELPIGTMRQTLLVTPDSKLIPVLYHLTTFILQQSMIQDYGPQSIPVLFSGSRSTADINEQINQVESEICNMSAQYLQHCNDASITQHSIQQQCIQLIEQYNSANELHQSLQKQFSECTEQLKVQDCISTESIQSIQSLIQQVTQYSDSAEHQYCAVSAQLNDTLYGIDGDTLGNRNIKIDELLNNYHVTLKQVERQLGTIFGIGSTVSATLQLSDTQLQQQSTQTQTLNILLQQLQDKPSIESTNQSTVTNGDNFTATPIKQLVHHATTPTNLTITPFNDTHSAGPIPHTNLVVEHQYNEDGDAEWISADKQLGVNSTYVHDTLDINHLRISSISHFTNGSSRFSLANTNDCVNDTDGLLDD